MSNNTEPNKTGFTAKQKQELQKYTVYGLLVMICLGAMWFIFRPSSTEKEAEIAKIGINTDIPDPEKIEMTDSKKNAFEQDYFNREKDKKVKTLNNFALLLAGKNKTDTIKSGTDVEKKVNINTSRSYNDPPNSIQRSVNTYQKTNDAVSSFYKSSPSSSSNEEVKRLKNEIESLKEQMDDKKKETNILDEQTELMEKSYELASKYFPQGQIQTSPKNPVAVNGKSRNVVAVRKLDNDIVSTLAQNMDDEELIENHLKERNIGFHSSNETLPSLNKNTIQVCIDRNQTITNGQIVHLRLLVAIKVGNLTIPINTVIAGKGSIQNERLDITINSLEYDESIIDVDLIAYDMDGQKGIHVPDMMEINTLKEIGANMGSTLGSSINISTNAGAQIVSDVGKGLLQGTSKYIAKKIQVKKVHLKADYKVLLFQKTN